MTRGSEEKDPAKETGHRIRELRKWLRLSQEMVGKYLDLPRSAVSGIESGKRPVGVTEVFDLARLFHCDPKVLLGFALPPAAPTPEIHFLNPRSTSKRPIDEQDSREIENFYAFLRQRPEARTSGSEFLSGLKSKPPAEAAQALFLEFIQDQFPVDIFSLITRLGIHLRFSSLGELSGALIRDSDENGLICGIIINSDQPEERMRFSAAHELAHSILGHSPQEVRIYSHKGRNFDPMEKDADAFAADLLMPELKVKECVSESGESIRLTALDVFELSQDFYVSYQAMIYRLSSLQIISHLERDAFSKEKPSELLVRLQENQLSRARKKGKAHPKKIKFSPEQVLPPLLATAEEGALSAAVGSPDWVRLIQEQAWHHYLVSSPFHLRASDVKEVYEKTVLWIAEYCPLEFQILEGTATIRLKV